MSSNLGRIHMPWDSPAATHFVNGPIESVLPWRPVDIEGTLLFPIPVEDRVGDLVLCRLNRFGYRFTASPESWRNPKYREHIAKIVRGNLERAIGQRYIIELSASQTL